VSRAARPGLAGAAAASAAAFCILIALGIWQLQRREWKAGILAAIDRAESGAPVALHGEPLPFAKVSVTGTLLPQKALYGIDVREVGVAGQPREGAQVIGVLRRDGARPVVVDLGWMPVDNGAPDPRNRRSQGLVTITGYVRAPDKPGWLSATDDPGAGHFYTLDPARIAASLGVKDVEPFTLVAMGKPAGPDAPVPAEALPRPPNNHLNYAFTWFGLAAALVAVFVSWAVKGKPT
jgi:surfeit locus 1 family protein